MPNEDELITDAIPAAPADAPDVPVAPDATDDDPDLVPDDEMPEDADDGVDPTEDGPSARSHVLPPEAK